MESANDNPKMDDKSPGSQLQALREAAGFSRAYVAEQMRLTEDYILFLEGDEFERLPPEPYVLGYYRTYSRILSVPPQPLISSYREFRQQSDGIEAPVDEAVGTGSAHRDYYRKPMKLDRNTKLDGKVKASINPVYILIVVALAAIWIVVSLMTEKAEQTVSTAPEGAAVQISVPGTVGPAAEPPAAVDGEYSEAEMSDAFELAQIEGADTAAFPVIASDEPQALAENTGEEAVATPVPVLDRLSFVFSGECWLEVTGANGDVLAATLYQDGDTAQLAGVAPFEVMFGNARVVQLQLNGEAVALRPLENRKTLRLSVGSSTPAAAE